MTRTKISQVLDVTNNTVINVCRTFQTQRLDAIERKAPNREYGHSLDGEAEAYLVAITCSKPPEGRERWTLRMLQAELVKRNHVDEVSHETIRTALTPALGAVPGKKRTQAVVERNLVHSTESKCSFYMSDGRCVGCLQASV